MTVSRTLSDGVVTLTGKSLREATVYNTLGQLVLTKKEDTTTINIDLSDQPSGLYLLISVTDQNGQRRCFYFRFPAKVWRDYCFYLLFLQLLWHIRVILGRI